VGVGPHPGTPNGGDHRRSGRRRRGARGAAAARGDVGAWSGLTREEIEERWPGYLAARRSPPDFEGDEHLLARARAGLTAVADGSGAGDVLVVTHGGVIRTIERSLGATPDRLPNLGGRWIVADSPTSLVLGERVVLLEPDEVTLPRGPSEQDPVRPRDAAQ